MYIYSTTHDMNANLSLVFGCIDHWRRLIQLEAVLPMLRCVQFDIIANCRKLHLWVPFYNIVTIKLFDFTYSKR